MKKINTLIKLFITGLFIVQISCGTKSNIPDQVLSSFKKMYPEAKNAKWDNINDSIYETSFKLKDKVMTSQFLSTGTWVVSKSRISSELLPKKVIDKMDGFYSGYTITRSDYLEKPDFKGYDIGIEVNSQKIDLNITETGELRKAQAVR